MVQTGHWAREQKGEMKKGLAVHAETKKMATRHWETHAERQNRKRTGSCRHFDPENVFVQSNIAHMFCIFVRCHG